MPTTIFHNAQIHSHSDPFAEALAVQDGTIAWLGAEESIAQFATNANEYVDLAGAIVVPSFVDAGLFLHPRGLVTSEQDLQDLQEWGSSVGLAAAIVRVEDARLPDVIAALSRHSEGLDVTAARMVSGIAVRELPTPAQIQESSDLGVRIGLDLTVEDSLPSSELIGETYKSGTLYICGGVNSTLTSVEIENWVAKIKGSYSGLQALRIFSRILWVGELPQGLDFTVVGAWSLLCGTTSDTREASSSGLTVALSAGFSDDKTVSYWQILRQALVQSQSWTGRSALRSMSRAGWRILGYPERGDLTIGSPAFFNAWQHEGYGVLAPKGELASWSAEAQAGSPVLPDVTIGTDHIVLVSRQRG